MVEISFIIPAYNEATLLPATLVAVRREIERSGVSAEIIVVDNGSYDDTAKVVNWFTGTRLVTELKRGLANARSAGLAVASGDLIAQIDSDTIIPENWLRHSLNEFRRIPPLVALSGPNIYYDLPLVCRVVTKLYYGFGLLIVLACCPLKLVGRPVSFIQGGGNSVIRRDAIQSAGGYNQKFQFYGEDTDLACRLAQKGSVRFSFKLAAYSSGRRFRKEGFVRTGLRYGINFFWAALLKRPFTQRWRDSR